MDNCRNPVDYCLPDHGNLWTPEPILQLMRERRMWKKGKACGYTVAEKKPMISRSERERRRGPPGCCWRRQPPCVVASPPPRTTRPAHHRDRTRPRPPGHGHPSGQPLVHLRSGPGQRRAPPATTRTSHSVSRLGDHWGLSMKTHRRRARFTGADWGAERRWLALATVGGSE